MGIFDKNRTVATPPSTNVLSQLKEAALKNVNSTTDPSVRAKNQRIYDELSSAPDNETSKSLAQLAAYATKLLDGKVIAVDKQNEPGSETYRFIACGCEISVTVRRLEDG